MRTDPIFVVMLLVALMVWLGACWLPFLENMYFRFRRFLLRIQGRWVTVAPRGYADNEVIQEAVDYVSRPGWWFDPNQLLFRGRSSYVELEPKEYIIEDTIRLGDNVCIFGTKPITNASIVSPMGDE